MASYNITDRQIDRQTAVILPPSLRMSYSSEALEHKAYAYESLPQVSLKANTASPINEEAAAA